MTRQGLLYCYIAILFFGLTFLIGCRSDVGLRTSEVGDGITTKVENGGVQAEPEEEESAVFFLDIDGETFEIEAPAQEKFTAYDILSLHAKEKNVILKTREYSFGLFIEGIGDKIGDKNHFWLYYINDKLASASVDNTVVKPGDVIRFAFTSNNPF